MAANPQRDRRSKHQRADLIHHVSAGGHISIHVVCDRAPYIKLHMNFLHDKGR